MRPREIAGVLGLGRAYFMSYWGRPHVSTENPIAVQDRTRSIFVHIPKTAGLSVWTALYGETKLFGHAPAHAFHRRDPARFARYFSFTLLRHPEARFVSAFAYMKQGGLTPDDKAWADRNLARYDTPDALARAMANPLVRGRMQSWNMFSPQEWYVCSPPGPRLLDFMGRTESFDASLARIGERLGIKVTPTHRNASRKSGDTGLSAEARRVLNRAYAADYALYEAADA